MTSLWTLAQERRQPDFQYMDQETLNQIEQHKPDFQNSTPSIVFSIEELELIRDLAPQREWYLDSRIITSIHGIAHTTRVMLYALALSRETLNKEQLQALLIACAVHDTQRKNDKGDIGHEERAVEWLRQHYNTHPQYNEVCLTLSGAGELEKYLRTADALDRYRLPKVKWWIDDSYLTLKPKTSFKAYAFALVIQSEQARIEGQPDVDCVIRNACKIN